MTGISVVIPVHNGAEWLRDAIDAIAEQARGRRFEILVVDDGSTDRSRAIAEDLGLRWPVRILDGEARGAAAAMNAGIAAAQFPLICQLDQDVVVLEGWLDRLIGAMADPEVAAAQGHYVPAEDATIPARISGCDLAQRYSALGKRGTDHVCTGNTIYRASALHQIGGFDESFGYGYDNDLSYRLRHAGFRLAFVGDARSVHHWSSTIRGYCAQQYGQGYGRLQLVAKHPTRAPGDAVSRWPMMLHAGVMALALATLLLAMAIEAVAHGPVARALTVSGLALIGMLAMERMIAGVGAARLTGRATPLLFPIFHLLRDVVWVGAMAAWTARRLARVRPRPTDSMGRGPAAASPLVACPPPPVAAGPRAPVLILIPAHNESQALPRVIADVREYCASAEILVIDDGSSDDTAEVAEREGVNWIQLPVRMGIGGAMRAGLRYARRRRASVVVRIDGDGQHRAEDVASLIAPVLSGQAEVVLGSRYVPSGEGRRGSVRLVQRLLGFCLSRITGQQVTDPTSGFYALAPKAVRLLCDHHPTGYPEPELRLLLSRCNVRMVETAMRSRSRIAGRTSLTPLRLAGAGARVLLAMLIVPFRHADMGEHD
jgi:glycosyltransferase involved in cell wall biosynthesis